MQAHRITVVTALLLSIALSFSAFATRSRDQDDRQIPRSQRVRKTDRPANPWIGTVITILDWLSIPPG